MMIAVVYMSPASVTLCLRTMFNAATANSVLRRLAIDQQVAFLEQASRMNARYIQPSQLVRYVMSTSYR